jgi:hypothetical protein
MAGVALRTLFCRDAQATIKHADRQAVRIVARLGKFIAAFTSSLSARERSSRLLIYEIIV